MIVANLLPSPDVDTTLAQDEGDWPSFRGPLGVLSNRALTTAPRTDDRQAIFRHLYDFHVPPGGSQQELQARESAAAPEVSGLGLDTLGLPRGWRRSVPLDAELAASWIVFESAPQPEDLDHQVPRVGFKLYLSPAARHLAATLRELFAVLPGSRASSVKVGASVAQLERPDKLVVYLPRYEDLRQLTWRLSAKLSGLSAHGVPFTAALDSEGLMSWGVDGIGGHSWRGFVLRRLATMAPILPGDDWQKAFDALRADGVEIEIWRPTAWLYHRTTAP